jgi:hypothetical protein
MQLRHFIIQKMPRMPHFPNLNWFRVALSTLVASSKELGPISKTLPLMPSGVAFIVN